MTDTNNNNNSNNINSSVRRQRRSKRDKLPLTSCSSSPNPLHSRRRQSKALQRHANDSPSGGLQSLLPSLIGVAVLACGVMAKMGFRGRASVAGIDLGTTNSVICVQSPAKGVGDIQCVPDPFTKSPIVPSVVSFLEPYERKVGPSSKVPSLLNPHPSFVVVGSAAKRRIDSHPHHTLYHAKRVLGRSLDDTAVEELRKEVEFQVVDDHVTGEVAFSIPETLSIPNTMIRPHHVGSYVVNHLIQITKQFLGHENIKSAVICVPAKFNEQQIRMTHQAFKDAGVSVARVVEEPTAAALAYGLHRKAGVDYILVYDFGGGTLDVSLLHVSDGFVDVMGSDGDDRLGGADFDAAVAHFLLEKRGGNEIVQRTTKDLHQLEGSTKGVADLEEKLSASCPALRTTPLCTVSSFHTIGEQLKIALSEFPNHDGKAEAECLSSPKHVDRSSLSMEQFCASLEPFRLELTSQEFDHAVQSLYDRSITPLQRLLADLDLKHDSIDEIVMVGGTTRMPQIRMLVRNALPSAQLNTHIDPDITVAYGAASVID